MKKKLTLLLAILITITSGSLQKANAQANTNLSNLVSPTAVNQSLVPGSDSVKNLGSAAKNWGTGYLYQLKLRKNKANNGNILNANGIELGFGVAGKEGNAGKIGYSMFTPNTLDIVGAGNTSTTRAIKFWAEAGSTFRGNIEVTTTTALNAIYGFSNVSGGAGVVGECNNADIDFSTPVGVWGKSSPTRGSGYAGFFSGNLAYTGNLVKASDQRLKENIKPLDNVLDKLMLLKPSSYNYKSEFNKMNLSQGEQMGFIAQEMEKVFPQLVHVLPNKQADGTRIPDYKGIDYVGLIPLLTKAIQDQQEEINELKQQVKQLAGNAALSENASSAKAINLSNAVLSQNVPNPFSSTTSIQYNIPAHFKSAQMVITDANGTVVKQVALSASGRGTININAYNFASGTYTYSLVVDGGTVGSKKMMVGK